MQEIEVMAVSLDEDLANFSVYLWQQKIPHRIAEQGDRQVIWVNDPAQADRVRSEYDKLRSGHLRLRSTGVSRPWFDWRGGVLRMLSVPVTALFIVLSIAGYLLAVHDPNSELLWQLYFFTVEESFFSAEFSVPAKEYWRLITPIFLHFSLLHIVFNSLMFWEFGRRIERRDGHLRFLCIVLCIAAVSNINQFLVTGFERFGGMSGVIYGLVGFTGVWSWLRPRDSYELPVALYVGILLWLVACYLGVASLLGEGAVANAAHLGGLIIGAVLGLGASLFAGIQRDFRSTDSNDHQR